MIQENQIPWVKRVCIATPSKGDVKVRWAQARYQQSIPINWGCSGFGVDDYDVLGYTVDDAFNIIAKHIIEKNYEWLIVIEDDVIVPPNLLITFNEYMTGNKKYKDKAIPIVSGLYKTKCRPSEPIVLRGRGNGAYTEFEEGEPVWCDGFGLGCVLIHCSLIRYMWGICPEYRVNDGNVTRKVFHTSRSGNWDILKGKFELGQGTQDLWFYDNLVKHEVYAKCGFPDIQKKKYPLLCDTSIRCGHIDRNTGKVY